MANFNSAYTGQQIDTAVGATQSNTTSIQNIETTLGQHGTSISGNTTAIANLQNAVNTKSSIILVSYWQSTTPSNPTEGQYWVNPDTKDLKIANGSGWSIITKNTSTFYIDMANKHIYLFYNNVFNKMV